MAHVGLTQAVKILGGHLVQGRAEAGEQIVRSCGQSARTCVEASRVGLIREDREAVWCLLVERVSLLCTPAGGYLCGSRYDCAGSSWVTGKTGSSFTVLVTM